MTWGLCLNFVSQTQTKPNNKQLAKAKQASQGKEASQQAHTPSTQAPFLAPSSDLHQDQHSSSLKPPNSTSLTVTITNTTICMHTSSVIDHQAEPAHHLITCYILSLSQIRPRLCLLNSTYFILSVYTEERWKQDRTCDRETKQTRQGKTKRFQGQTNG